MKSFFILPKTICTTLNFAGIFKSTAVKLRTSTNEQFEQRHIGPRPHDVAAMLTSIGAESLDSLINQTVPENIRLKRPLNISQPMTEHNYFKRLKAIAQMEKHNHCLSSCSSFV